MRDTLKRCLFVRKKVRAATTDKVSFSMWTLKTTLVGEQFHRGKISRRENNGLMYHVTRVHTVMYIERSNKHVAYSPGPLWLRLRYGHESHRAALARSLRWIASLINCVPFAVDTFLRLASRHGLAFSAPLPPQFVNLQLLSACPIASNAHALSRVCQRTESWTNRALTHDIQTTLFPPTHSVCRFLHHEN